VAALDPPDPDGQLRLLCQALNEVGVAYVVFGSQAATVANAYAKSYIGFRRTKWTTCW
jgi:hypothetical protein